MVRDKSMRCLKEADVQKLNIGIILAGLVGLLYLWLF